MYYGTDDSWTVQATDSCTGHYSQNIVHHPLENPSYSWSSMMPLRWGLIYAEYYGVSNHD